MPHHNVRRRGCPAYRTVCRTQTGALACCCACVDLPAPIVLLRKSRALYPTAHTIEMILTDFNEDMFPLSASDRTVLFVLGVMLASLSAAMLAPALVDLYDAGQSAHAFFGTGALGLTIGGIMAMMGRGTKKKPFRPRCDPDHHGVMDCALSGCRHPAETVRGRHRLDRRAI